MELKNTIDGTIVIIIAVCLVCGMLVPIIDGMVEGESTVNPDAGWIRMNYDTAAGSAYTVTITPGDDGITVANGSDTQTGSDDTIFYADSNVAVWMQDGTVNILGQNTDGPQFLQPEEAITVTRTAEGVTVASGGDSLSFAAPAWAYVPFSSGSYGYFTDGTAVKTNSPMAAVGGGFAGVYAYNDITRYAGLGLQLQTVMEDGKLTGAYWAKAAAADSLSITPFDPGSITIQPLDPSILDPEPDVSIMAVPTPTYTDGDWGYDLETIDGVQKAIIVSYSGSGAGGVITVPASVGGYDVYRLGKNPVDNSDNRREVIASTATPAGTRLVISEGIKQIGGGAFTDNTKIAYLELPKSLETIGRYAFFNAGLTEMPILHDSLKQIYAGSFGTNSNISGTIVIPSSVEMIGGSVFSSDPGISTVIIASNATPGNSNAFSGVAANGYVLDLSDAIDYSVDRYGLAATATVQDNIGDSAGYIGVAYVAGANPLGDGATAILMAVPVVILASLLGMIAVAVFKRDY